MLVCWNMRILLDLFGSEWSERRIALIGTELGRYSLDIVALSRLSNDGQIEEVGCLYFLLQSKIKEWTSRSWGRFCYENMFSGPSSLTVTWFLWSDDVASSTSLLLLLQLLLLLLLLWPWWVSMLRRLLLISGVRLTNSNADFSVVLSWSL